MPLNDCEPKVSADRCLLQRMVGPLQFLYANTPNTPNRIGITPNPLNSVCRMMPGVLFFNRHTTYENPTVTGSNPMTSHHLNAWKNAHNTP